MPKRRAAFPLMVALAACSGKEGAPAPAPTTQGNDRYAGSAASVSSSAVSQNPLVAGQVQSASVALTPPAAALCAGAGFAQTVGMPSKVVGVHFAAWETGVNIQDITQDANVIYLFNLRPHPGEVGTWYWEWPGWPSQGDVQAVRARGQKVILSLGGAGFPFKFDARAKTQATLDAIRTQIDDNFGPVDGIELNTFEGEEGGVKRAALSDPAEILWLIQQLRAQYDSGFALTIPPAPNYPEDLQLATALASNGALTWAAPQFYDWSGFNDPGFISNRMRQWVGALGPTKSVMGVSANYPNGPTLADSTREWDIIEAEFPSIRGAVAWNAQLNHQGGNQWTATMKDRVIGSAPPPLPPGNRKVQAENGTLTGVSVETNHPGYEGAGFVHGFVDAGDKLTVAFDDVAAGTYDVRIRYQAWTQQYNYVSVNNAPTQPDHFPATGSSWAIKTVSGVELGDGANTVTIDTYWGYIAVDSIEIVPSTVGGPSFAMTCADGALLAAGSYTVENNQWGKAGVTDPYSQCVGNGGLAADGSVSARWTWTWPSGPSEVKGYPAIVFGQKPGYDSTPGSNLPRRLDLLSQATSSWSTQSTHTGTGQLTFDLWLTSDDVPHDYFLDAPITHEIMVAVEPYDGYGMANPAWFVEDIAIDGVDYSVYKADDFPPAAEKQWRFLVFRVQTPRVQGALDFKPLFAYLQSRGFIAGNEYLSSIEFGTEPVEGSGDVTVNSFQATVH